MERPTEEEKSLQIFSKTRLQCVARKHVKISKTNLKAPPYAADPNIDIIGRRGHVCNIW